MRLDARIQTLRLAETFRIARSSQDEAETVVVAIEHDGVTGYGEAAPIDRYEESAASALAYAQEAAGALGDDPFALDEILDRLPRREWAARAAHRRRAARPPGEAARRPDLAAARAPPRRAAHLVDARDRRPRRDGAQGRGARPAASAASS